MLVKGSLSLKPQDIRGGGGGGLEKEKLVTFWNDKTDDVNIPVGVRDQFRWGPEGGGG